MSGRHKMPPAGRRKAAANPAETVEQAAGDEAPSVPETVEGTQVELPADTTVEESETAVEEAADLGEPAEAQEVEPVDEVAAPDEPDEAGPASRTRRRVNWPIVLSAIALVLAVAAGVFRWLIVWDHDSDTARTESVQAAKDITSQMLSYETETVEQQLNAARDRLTGDFLGTYTAMTNEIIPAAQAQRIAAVADVPRAAVVSATPDSAEVILFVNQAVQTGDQMPQRTLSVARATMVKEGDRWLMSEYAPVPM